MRDDELMVTLAHEMANVVTSIHFHNQGLMDDQVNPEEWDEYSFIVYDKILTAAEKMMD